MMKFGVTTEEERIFERNLIQKQQDTYLRTDVLEKILNDPGYSYKVNQIRSVINRIKGWILDVGSNTAGECEFLTNNGFKFVASDVNEVALSISKRRCSFFNRASPLYVACDGIALPFAENSFEAVTYFESLHHIPDPQLALREAYRVLAPGGAIAMLEPYAYDPWRRISEVRDYIRGRIEMSFSESRLKRLLENAGFIDIEITRPVVPPSSWKIHDLPWWHSFLRNAYYRTRKRFPSVLGMVLCCARKQGRLEAMAAVENIFDRLVCPTTGSKLIAVSDGYLSKDDTTRYLYPNKAEIPLLIASEAIELSNDEYAEALASFPTTAAP